MNQVTVTVKSGNTEATYTAPDASISGNGDQYHPVLNIRLDNYKAAGLLSCVKVEGYTKEPAQTPHDKLVASHTQVILDVLKDAEESLVQAQMLRAKLEAEAELHKLESRGKIMKAVHDAIQAGLDMEDVTKDMRDDYAGYVSDMADQVYLETDLDTVVNGS